MEYVYMALSFIAGLGIVIPYLVKVQNVLGKVADVFPQVAELIDVIKESPAGGFNHSDTEKIIKEAKDVADAVKEVGEAIKAFKKK